MEDLAKVLEGTVDDVKPRLDALSVATLEELKTLEHGASARTTLIEAIERAIAAKTDEAQQGGAPGDDSAERMFTQAELDEAIATREAAWKADTERQVAEAKGKPAAKPAKPKAAKPLVIGEGKEGFALLALTKGIDVVFVDDQDVPLPELPAMSFMADAFEPAGAAVRMTRKVSFPNTLPANEVSGAFLVSDSIPLAKARLIGPQPIGGGRDVELPAGALMFAKE